MTLTGIELRALTGKQRSDAQRRELDHMGIPYFVRRDGTLAVMRIHVEGTPNKVTIEPKEPEMMP